HRPRGAAPAPPPAPPPPATRVDFFSGLDLGQMQDFTALVVVERTRAADDPHRYDVRHLHRWPLGTSYTRIADDVRGWFAGDPLKGSTLVVDATGVGAAVVDSFRAGGIT